MFFLATFAATGALVFENHILFWSPATVEKVLALPFNANSLLATSAYVAC
jgi:hypothetical protein